MREIRQSGSEGGVAQPNAPFLPLFLSVISEQTIQRSGLESANDEPLAWKAERKLAGGESHRISDRNGVRPGGAGERYDAHRRTYPPLPPGRIHCASQDRWLTPTG